VDPYEVLTVVALEKKLLSFYPPYTYYTLTFSCETYIPEDSNLRITFPSTYDVKESFPLCTWYGGASGIRFGSCSTDKDANTILVEGFEKYPMNAGVEVKIRFNAVKAGAAGTGRIQVLKENGKIVCGAVHIMNI
jgi:hypothetical protein